MTYSNSETRLRARPKPPAAPSDLRQGELREPSGRASHAISIRLSPLTIRCCLDDRMSLESWWQNEKCLAVWR